MSGYTLRPAIREQTPLIIGVAGPTKSGKTYSAHRIARGLVGPMGKVAMLNAESKRGHQYAGAPFSYLKADIEAPYRVEKYTAAVKEIAEQGPDCLIIDSVSHMHDGPGGMLDEHEEIVKRMAGNEEAKRDRVNFAAWVKPKQDENRFIYTLLSLAFPVILCLRAKEKIKLVGGKPIEMGWQPIVSDRVAFETIFTLMLPPHSKGVPDLASSDMRSPFDTMVPAGKPLDESLGRKLAEWARGVPGLDDVRAAFLTAVRAYFKGLSPGARLRVAAEVFKVETVEAIGALPTDVLEAALAAGDDGIGPLEAAVIAERERGAA